MLKMGWRGSLSRTGDIFVIEMQQTAAGFDDMADVFETLAKIMRLAGIEYGTQDFPILPPVGRHGRSSPAPISEPDNDCG